MAVVKGTGVPGFINRVVLTDCSPQTIIVISPPELPGFQSRIPLPTSDQLYRLLAQVRGEGFTDCPAIFRSTWNSDGGGGT